jgi:cytochrome c biogenesis protein CcdA/thiol-disulfide isomerase/thioredoxin
VILFFLAFVGGILTIASPCILPVLPFVFSRADQPFRRSGLPLLAGMAVTFAVVAGVATVAGGWIVRANQIGRGIAVAAFVVLGLTLLVPSFAELLSRPFVRLGSRFQQTNTGSVGTGKSFLLGVSTGLLWAPCAGPILGLILAGAAISGASWSTVFLLLAFAFGAACSLGLALLVGGKAFAYMKKSLAADEWIRRVLGVAVLTGAAAVAFGWDTGFLRRISTPGSSSFEQRLVDRLHPVAYAAPQLKLDNEGTFPGADGAAGWLNSPALSRKSLKGKVVMVDFWTYSCINCLRAIPYVEAWYEKYKNDGFVVIGVHTPEFAFEKDENNIKKAVKDLGITYPVAIDSNYAIWNAFHNQYWPAHYFIDANGAIRHHHFGEGDYEESEQVIQQLLKERSADLKVSGFVQVQGTGVEAAPDSRDVRSPETYIGYERQQNFLSPEKLKRDGAAVYSAPGRLDVNNWGLAGKWNVENEHATLLSAPGKIVFRFHARDLHLVLGPTASGKPVRFHVLIDGSEPGDDHGVDVNAKGEGTVREQRLYQLVRQKGKVEDRTFQIEFLDPGVQAFAFTFG